MSLGAVFSRVSTNVIVRCGTSSGAELVQGVKAWEANVQLLAKCSIARERASNISQFVTEFQQHGETSAFNGATHPRQSLVAGRRRIRIRHRLRLGQVVH